MKYDSLRIPFLLVVLAAFPASIAADSIEFDSLADLSNRNYTLDLYQGSVLGSARIVGMGGASVALAEGSAGTVANPAAPAVRPATSNRNWDWDWHLDWLNPDLGSDFDNNGLNTDNETSVAPLLTAGFVGQYKTWGISFNATAITNTAEPENGEQSVTTDAQIFRMVVAKSFLEEVFTLGIGIRIGSLDLTTEDNTQLFSIVGTGLELGAVWRPAQINLRVGSTLSLPISGRDINNSTCDPFDCGGYILPEEVAVPWSISTGVAWRFAPTRWNQHIRKPFRDERALTVAGDIVITGPVKNGHGIEAFTRSKLQPSGQDTVFSFRSGVEYELTPGRLRLRAGGYWEPGRFENIRGRIHGTAGVEVRFWSFRLWGSPYRLRASVTGDFAKKYINTGISIGFWH